MIYSDLLPYLFPFTLIGGTLRRKEAAMNSFFMKSALGFHMREDC